MYKISGDSQFTDRQVIFLPKCPSTNDIASGMIKNGMLEEGSLVITNEQHAGKGQQGNVWISNAGENLTFSLALKPHFVKPADMFMLNIITSVALVEALRTSTGKIFKIKWPNDIMYGNQKIGGILIENSIQSDKILSAIIGIGININQEKFDGKFQAISLKNISGRTYDLNSVLNQIVHQLDACYARLRSGKWQNLKKNYLEALYWLNESHTFYSREEFIGVITGIDQAGRLLVDGGGRTLKFNFKEITYLK